MKTRARIARIIVAGAAVLGLAIGGMTMADAAYAADGVSISTTTSTVASNTLVTYTLNVSCSTTPSCGASDVTFATGNLTGDGATTDFQSWFGNGSCPAVDKTVAGKAAIHFASLTNGSLQCTFTVRAPNKTTLNGTQATLTPVLTTNGGQTTGASSVLTISSPSSGYNDGLGAGVNPTSVYSGDPLTLTFTFACGTGTGDLALQALHIQDQLPANFTFAGLTTTPVAANLQGTIVAPAVGSSGGTITYDGNGTDCNNPTNNRIVFTVTGTAATAGTPDAVGDKICNSGATSSFTYIDGHPATAAPANPAAICATVVDHSWTSAKVATTGTFGNVGGTYKAIDGTAASRYTFPGDWDSSGGDTTFTIGFNASPAVLNAGITYTIQDPLPCLDNPTGTLGATYSSKAPGAVCANPAYVPKVVTSTGFTPAAGSLLDLRFADGTSGTVPYVTGTGWTLPTSPAVSEIDFRPYPEEAANTATSLNFTMSGYAVPEGTAGKTIAGHNLTNTAVLSATYNGAALKTPQTRATTILVADATTGGDSGTIAAGSISTNTVANQTCTERVTFSNGFNANVRNQIEIASGPSKAIYLDYLAPVGAGTITGTTVAFSLVGNYNGHTYTTDPITPTTTADYNGTGRTQLEWVIPAGTALVAGNYQVIQTVNTGFQVTLPPGCAGTYQNALTMGYGAPINTCFWTTSAGATPETVPFAAPSNPALGNTGAPTNYCGYNATFNVTPSFPQFNVDKTVQGDLDGSPVGLGGIGKVSPTGGSATYKVTFSNPGKSNLHDPVMYDLLPRVGDTEAWSLTPRNSQFAVSLNAVPAPVANVTIEYSTATDPCRPEVLANASNPGCVDDWSTTPPASLASVTALRFAYSGTVGVVGSAVNSFSITYTASTPATAIGNIAYNTVGTNVRIGDSGDDTEANDPFLGAAESPATGVTASSSVPTIVKATSTPTFEHVGDTLSYTFDVTNNATADLTAMTLADAFTDGPAGATAPVVTCQSLSSPAGACSGASTPLAAGQTAHFTATYTVTQADLDHGLLTDVATATGTSSAGGTISNSSNAVTVNAIADPDLVLTKTASVASVDAAGQTIGYTFHVVNNGNQTVNALAIDDSAGFSGSDPLGAITCGATTLVPGANTDCHVDYGVTQADVDAGDPITNSATATGTSAGAAVTSNADEATVTVDQSPALTLDKSASVTEVDAVGDEIDYTFAVENTGNVTLTDVAIDDTFGGTGSLGAITCLATKLDPAAATTCSASYVVTQQDLDSGSVLNSATASADDPSGARHVSGSSSADVAVTPHVGLTLQKVASTSTISAPGPVGFTFTITNTGNVQVTGITLDDAMLTVAATCPSTTLAAGDSETCTGGSYTATQDDIDAGGFDNTATVNGTSAGQPVSAQDTAHVTATRTPGIALVKSSPTVAVSNVGDVIDFEFTVTNTGNVTLTDIAINESFQGKGPLAPVVCDDLSLKPSAVTHCRVDYPIVQEDIDAGSVTNSATASGTDPNGAVTTSDPSPVSVAVTQTGGLTLAKTTTSGPVDAVGQTVTFHFHVENTGNVQITNLVIVDGMLSAAPDCGTTLAAGASADCSADYTVTQADLDAGTIHNDATAMGSAAGQALSAASAADVAVTQNPHVTLTKSATQTTVEKVGDPVDFQFDVVNDGNVTLHGVAVADQSMPSLTVDCPPGTGTTPLAPGDHVNCTASYATTQADLDNGSIANTAIASGIAPQAQAATDSAQSTATVTAIQDAGLTLTKTADVQKVTAAGQTIGYAFHVENTGNVTLTDVEVQEGAFTGTGSVPTVDCPTTGPTLAPGATLDCTASYTLLATDQPLTTIDNTATATGVAPAGSVTSDPSTADVSVDVPAPAGLAETGVQGVATGLGAGAGLLGLGALLFFFRRRRNA